MALLHHFVCADCSRSLKRGRPQFTGELILCTTCKTVRQKAGREEEARRKCQPTIQRKIQRLVQDTSINDSDNRQKLLDAFAQDRSALDSFQRRKTRLKELKRYRDTLARRSNGVFAIDLTEVSRQIERLDRLQKDTIRLVPSKKIVGWGPHSKATVRQIVNAAARKFRTRREGTKAEYWSDPASLNARYYAGLLCISVGLLPLTSDPPQPADLVEKIRARLGR